MQYVITVRKILINILFSFIILTFFCTSGISFRLIGFIKKSYGCYINLERCFVFADWFRAVRFLELMAFMGMLGLMGLVVAYMFFLREIKYIFIQWIIIGMCFGVGKTHCLSATANYLSAMTNCGGAMTSYHRAETYCLIAMTNCHSAMKNCYSVMTSCLRLMS